MKKQLASIIIIICFASLLFGGRQVLAEGAAPTSPQDPLGSDFTYQGRLKDGDGNPITSTCDFRFRLWNTEGGGSQVGVDNIVTGVSVIDGYFTAQVNSGGEFGSSAFTDQARWLEVSVKCSGEADYTLLDPRQPLTAPPYASYTAGDGLTLDNHQFSIAFGADGTADTVAHSDHNHLGETWLGSGSLPLVISGTFGGDDRAPLVLSSSGTSGRGLSIIRAEETGVYIHSAESGVVVNSADFNGMQIYSAGNTGIYIGTTGSDGLHVGSADNDGVSINTAVGDGVSVDSAGNMGVHVTNALTGFGVNSASAYGLSIGSSGSDGVYINSTDHHGIYIATTLLDGVYINSAGDDGVTVYDAVDDGMYVGNAGDDGLYVGMSADNGIDVAGDDYAGYFVGDIYVSGSCFGCTLATFGVNTGVRPLEPGEVVTILGMRASDMDNAPALWEVLPAVSGQALVGVVQGRAELVVEDEHRPQETGRRLVPRDGAAGPGEYVTIIIYGPVQVQVSPASGSIAPGMHLAIDENGLARPLKTVTVEGVNLAESAPTIGIALSAPDEQGLVWVLVNPQ
jgi:hypothetical protein